MSFAFGLFCGVALATVAWLLATLSVGQGTDYADYWYANSTEWMHRCWDAEQRADSGRNTAP